MFPFIYGLETFYNVTALLIKRNAFRIGTMCFKTYYI